MTARLIEELNVQPAEIEKVNKKRQVRFLLVDRGLVREIGSNPITPTRLSVLMAK